MNDGFADEWQELFEPTATAFDFRIAQQQEYDPADLDVRLWMGWLPSPARIYVAAMVVDDHRTGGDGIFEDSLFFKLDADHSGGEATAEYLDRQAYHSFPDIPEKSFHTTNAPPGGWTTAFPYGEGDGVSVGENPSVWHIEFYITPFDALYEEPDESSITELVSGKTIGFACVLVDADGDGGGSIGGFFDYHNLPRIDDNRRSSEPEFFADGILLGAKVGDEVDSAVSADSWARIKASFGE